MPAAGCACLAPSRRLCLLWAAAAAHIGKASARAEETALANRRNRDTLIAGELSAPSVIRYAQQPPMRLPLPFLLYATALGLFCWAGWTVYESLPLMAWKELKLLCAHAI